MNTLTQHHAFWWVVGPINCRLLHCCAAGFVYHRLEHLSCHKRAIPANNKHIQVQILLITRTCKQGWSPWSVAAVVAATYAHRDWPAASIAKAAFSGIQQHWQQPHRPTRIKKGYPGTKQLCSLFNNHVHALQKAMCKQLQTESGKMSTTSCVACAAITQPFGSTAALHRNAKPGRSSSA